MKPSDTQAPLPEAATGRVASFPLQSFDTRARILEAATAVFLEKGFEAATVRDICARAGANVASVNYHFGSKEALYGAVLDDIFAACHDRYPLDMGLGPEAAPEALLEAFLRSMLLRHFPEDPALAAKSRLVSLEMANPSPVLGPMVERHMRPLKDYLMALVARFLPSGAPEHTLRHAAGAVVAVGVFHGEHQAILTRLFPDQTYGSADIAAMAAVLTRFCLGGLQALQAEAAVTGGVS